MIISVEAIASICHEANRRYCKSIGDDTQLPWDHAPSWQRESAISGVGAIIAGIVTSPRDSHESWLKDKADQGWKFGLVKKHGAERASLFCGV
jgi:hypothetical protein